MTGATDDVMMIEAEEEMTEETLAEIIVETSAETTDVAMTGITASGEMSAEIIETGITTVQSARRLLTMIGNVKNVITSIFPLEPSVIDAENQNQVEEEITETVDHVEMTGLDEIVGVVAETVDHAEMTGLDEIVGVVAETVDHAEMTVLEEREVHAESAEQEATTVQVEIVVEVIEVADRVESETQMLPNSVAPEANHQVMLITEDHNPSMLVL